ncbi:MAG TPA: alanyl-tRNA editing protein [Methylomirabilota bacterium]|nr:alanyl-tRNA editing protein [Methylomirabilota bacterium]
MERPAYERDAYLSEFDTEVVEVGRDGERPWAVTADTIFYPEGGGQPADRGRMGGVEVVDVRNVDGAIRHCLSRELAPGPVRQELDWSRRFDHMQQHSGQHLLTVVALQRFGWPTTAFHLGPELSDIELDVPSLGGDDLRRLEDAVNEEIRAAHPIVVRYAAIGEMETLGVRSRMLPEGLTGELRLVGIEGLDLNTCGGTHVRSTAEIGALALVGTEAMRGGTRLHFVAGDRLRRRLAAHEARNVRLRTLLDAADDDLPALVELRIGREKEMARERRRLLAELASAEAERLAVGPEGVLTAHWDDRDLPFLQEVGKALVALAPERVALLSSGCGAGGAFLVVAPEASGLDLASVGPELCALLDGRGGGRAPFFQGKAAAVDRRGDAAALLSRIQPPTPKT